MPTEPIRAPVGVNVPGFPMAGFQLTLHGRIWVTPEVIEPECLPKLSFDILGACEGLRTSLRGWIGQQTSPFTANQC